MGPPVMQKAMELAQAVLSQLATRPADGADDAGEDECRSDGVAVARGAPQPLLRARRAGPARPTVLVLDLDGTLRDPRVTDGQVPSRTVAALLSAMANHPELRVVFNTGQTLSHVQGLLQQLLGLRVLRTGRVAVVYERGAGVYLPGPDGDQKLLLFATLDPRLLKALAAVRGRLVEACSAEFGWGCAEYHVAGNEFNVAVRPNAPEGSPVAQDVTRRAAPLLIRLLAEAAAEEAGLPPGELEGALLFHCRRRNARLAGILAPAGPAAPRLPGWLRVSMFYFPGDMVGLSAVGLTKAAGLRAVLRHWGLAAAPMLLLGDGAEDLALMRDVAARGHGRVRLACPRSARREVVEFVRASGGLIYPVGQAERALSWAGL
jgi:hydroxymethylpyrimidine pyrophosphatase-like HAD family hydrolase